MYHKLFVYVQPECGHFNRYILFIILQSSAVTLVESNPVPLDLLNKLVFFSKIFRVSNVKFSIYQLSCQVSGESFFLRQVFLSLAARGQLS